MDVALENLPGKADSNVYSNAEGSAEGAKSPLQNGDESLRQKDRVRKKTVFPTTKEWKWRYILFSHSFSVSRYCRIYR